MEILLCTDGSNSSIQSADLVSQLKYPPDTCIMILGVSQNEADEEQLNQAIDIITKKLGDKCVVDKKLRSGNPSQEILAEALEHSYDLVAVGGGGGQLGLLHPQVGSTTSKLSHNLHTHFLVTRNFSDSLSKILVCVGTDTPANETLSLGGAWISRTGAQIGLLHVIPAGSKDSRAQSTPSHGNQPHDYVLESARKQLIEAGVKSDLVLHIREGLVVDEVVQVIVDQNYDLLVVGAHFQPALDRWQGMLLDDVTDKLLNRSTCSVLII